MNISYHYGMPMRANSSEAIVVSVHVFTYYLLRSCFILDIQQIHLDYIEKRLKACNECK